MWNITGSGSLSTIFLYTHGSYGLNLTFCLQILLRLIYIGNIFFQMHLYQYIEQYSLLFHYNFSSPGFLYIAVWMNKLGIYIVAAFPYSLAYITDVSIILSRYAVGLGVSYSCIDALCTLPLAPVLALILLSFFFTKYISGYNAIFLVIGLRYAFLIGLNNVLWWNCII